MQQDLPKKERLRNSLIIEKLFSEGKTLKKFPLRLIYLAVPGDFEVQAAFSVPKRKVKKAVDRNRIKRLMREAYRKNKYLVTSNLNSSSYALMFIYSPVEEESFQRVNQATRALLEDLVLQEKNKQG